MLMMLFRAMPKSAGSVHEVRRSNTDSAIAALYSLLDSSEDVFCSV